MIIKDYMNDKEFEALLESCGCGRQQGGNLDVFRQNLTKINEYSSAVLSMCQSHPEIEDWIEDKVSKMSQMISDVKHYLEYRGSTQSSADVPGTTSKHASMYSTGEKMNVFNSFPQMTPPSATYGNTTFVGAAEADDTDNTMIGDMDDAPVEVNDDSYEDDGYDEFEDEEENSLMAAFMY